MKKATTLIILLALLFSLNIPINAEELKPTCIKDDKIAELLTNSLPEDLTDTDVYSITIDGINVTDKPILKVFNYDSFRMAHLPLEDIIPNMSKETNINQKSLDYVIFDIIPRRVSAIKDIRTEDPDDYAIYRSDYCKDPPYVTDIINMELKTEILNVACEIKDMIAFDGFHSHMGAMLYVTTDKGVFVKYYTDEISEGTWFTEEDFQKFGKAYYEYLVEISCDHDVEPCGCLSPREEDTSLKFSYWWIAIPVGVCAVLALFAAFIYRKPRLNKNFKYM